MNSLDYPLRISYKDPARSNTYIPIADCWQPI